MERVMAISSDRNILRERLRAERRTLPAIARLRAADALAVRLDGLPALHAASRVAGYWAVDGELSLHALLAGALASRYCLPLIQPGRVLRFAPWRAGDPVQPNRYGIPEPATGVRLDAEQLDVVLLPLVGFDRRGNRLGSGAGFYDRTLAFLQGARRPARPLLVGIGYAAQEVDRLEAAEWDVPLDYVATEAELIRCEGG
jgi:5-formyltetrahydrofolate cyclo-ligase